MKLVGIALAFLIGSVPLAAQSPASPELNLFRIPIASSGCPVSMSLQQRLGNSAQFVRDGKRAPIPATQLHLRLAPQRHARHLPGRVQSAKVTVFGRSSAWRFEPARSGKTTSHEPVKTLTVQFEPAGDNSVAAELWLAGFGAVRSLQLDAIHYADGSTWEPAPGQSCQITPGFAQFVMSR